MALMMASSFEYASGLFFLVMPIEKTNGESRYSVVPANDASVWTEPKAADKIAPLDIGSVIKFRNVEMWVLTKGRARTRTPVCLLDEVVEF